MISFCFHPFVDVMRLVAFESGFHYPMQFDIVFSMRSPIGLVQHHRVLAIKIRFHLRICEQLQN